jgi:large subunit ribosomal protein L22
MGLRKKINSRKIKDVKKKIFFGFLKKNCFSPRKVRLVADIIRNKEVFNALNILKYSKNIASQVIEKLLISVIYNWKVKNKKKDIEEAYLYVKEIKVDGGSILNRLRPVPQGKSNKIRKRSSHIFLKIEDKNE